MANLSLSAYKSHGEAPQYAEGFLEEAQKTAQDLSSHAA